MILTSHHKNYLLLLFFVWLCPGANAEEPVIFERLDKLTLPEHFHISSIVASADDLTWAINVTPLDQQQPWTEVWSLDRKRGKLALILKAVKRLENQSGEPLRSGYCDYVSCGAVLDAHNFILLIGHEKGDWKEGPWPDIYSFDSTASELKRLTTDGERGMVQQCDPSVTGEIFFSVKPKPPIASYVKMANIVGRGAASWNVDEPLPDIDSPLGHYLRHTAQLSIEMSEDRVVKRETSWKLVARTFGGGELELMRAQSRTWPTVLKLPKNRWVVRYDGACDLLDMTSKLRISLSHVVRRDNRTMRPVGFSGNGRIIIFAADDAEGYTTDLWSLDLDALLKSLVSR